MPKRISIRSRCILILWPVFFASAARGAEPEPGSKPAEPEEVQIIGQREAADGSADSGYRSRSASAGPLGSMSLLDAPLSLHVTPGELIENRSAHTVSEALRTDPAVATLMEPSGYSSLSRVMIRGFTAADQSDLRDGLVDRSFTFVPLENVARIEVLNGLSGFLYGFSALGGTLNYVSKEPTPERVLSLSGGQYGGGIHYLHGDAGGPLDAKGRVGIRINLYGEDGGTYIEGSTQKRDLISGALRAEVLPNVVAHADVSFQSLDMKGLQTYFNVNPAGGIAVPSASAFSAKTQYGQDWTFNRSEKLLAGAGVTASFGEVFTVRAAYRHGTMWREYEYVGATLTDNSGAYNEKATGSTRQTERTGAVYALLDGSFKTWGAAHKVTAGYTDTGYVYTRGDDVSAALGASTAGAPVAYANPMLSIGPTNVWYEQDYRNLVLGDRVEFSPAWSALLGLNRAELQQTRWGTGSALATPNYRQSRVTPSAALTFKPAPQVATYASYMEGLVNGGTAPSTAANANEILGPSVGRQYELGAKGEVGRMSLTGALFYIDKVNEYVDPGDNVYKQDGREVHQGLELTASGKLVGPLSVVCGFTALDARIKKAANNLSLEGRFPVNVPRTQGRAYLEYGFGDLTLSAGAFYSGRRAVDAANTSFMAGAATFDAGVRYQVRLAPAQKVSLALNVSNLLDTAYWSYYRSGDGLLLGAPRVISFSARSEW